MKNRLTLLVLCSTFFIHVSAQITGGRLKEVFKETTLSAANVLDNPWEVAYGPDGYLWVTESKEYKVYRINPTTGAKTTVLDLSPASTDLSAWGADSLLSKNKAGEPRSPWNGEGLDGQNARFPQGGLAGLAIHPDFNDPDKAFVYVSYVHRFLGGTYSSWYTYRMGTGLFYRNKLVRFKYNSVTGKLGEPAVLCDTLPGSDDHNSQRMIIARSDLGGPYYLFYASGDMGAGQYGNRYRENKAQNPQSYEGKILRFNLESDGETGHDGWIPNTNPYNSSLGVQSAVYSIGIRNNQGFAYDSDLNILYGGAHGAYSDDEIDIILPRKNYGHPLISGYAADGNYNGNNTTNSNGAITLGTYYGGSGKDYGNSSLAPVVNEQTNKNTINAYGLSTYGETDYYQDPIFSAYPTPLGTISTSGIAKIWGTAIDNSGSNWASEAWSGLDLYQHTLIPGWHKSLVAASLKWGRLTRLRMGADGKTTLPSGIGGSSGNVGDTVSYFDGLNRYRDLAFSPDGKDIFIVMDKSSATSGPSTDNPSINACPGCLIKYTFLGYADNAGKSTIPTSVAITDPTTDNCIPATTIVINDDNKNLWVPITGPDGNILAEIYPNGNVLGTVTTTIYKNSGAIRIKQSVHYLDRNITITPENQPTTTVKIRLYVSKAEVDAMVADPASGITSYADLKILKNNDNCSSNNGSLTANTTIFESSTVTAHGANGYVVQLDALPSFSSFYFAAAGSSVLPVNLVNFSGTLQMDNSVLLTWKTEGEQNASSFIVERSLDATNFTIIGTEEARGISASYSLTDNKLSGIAAATVIYYRLKMLDADGSYKYSPVITVSLSAATGKVSLWPNPAGKEVRVSIDAKEDGPVQLTLTDNTGRTVKQVSGQVKKRTANNITINLQGLSSGIYYLKVSGGGIQQLLKVQKL